ncbi:MAG: glutathione synthase, partial [Kangiellaceae bacterium]|nr:glutathione synthase [Kangiellaceae bacterium]
MSLRFGVIMDPVEKITPYKDSTLAMMLAIQQRDAEIIYIEPADIFVSDGSAYANGKQIKVFDSNEHWFECGESIVVPLGELDILLMRKDPPFNTEYIFATYALDLAKRDGALVANDPRALRNFNEKFTISYFPQC